jgi:hypothetical protein
MKKITIFAMSALLCFALVFQLGGNAHAQWKLYDDFNSGIIDTDKWNLPGAPLTSFISIENGKLKIDHPEGWAFTPVWLQIKKHPERIRGIKATVKIEWADGDSFRARVGGWIGDFGEEKYPVFAQTVLWFRSDDWGGNRMYSAASVHADEPGTPWIADYFWSALWTPIDVIGEIFTIELFSDQAKVGYGVEGLGSGIFTLPQKLRERTRIFNGIGTVALSPQSKGLVYFDDVYVLMNHAQAPFKVK